MNTTMAPMDQIRQESIEKIRQRHVKISLVGRRDGGKGGSSSNGGNGERDGGNSGPDSSNSGNGGGGSGGGDGGSNNGDNSQKDSNQNDGNSNDNNPDKGGGSKNTDQPKDQKTAAFSDAAAATQGLPPPPRPQGSPTTIVLVSTTTASVTPSTTTVTSISSTTTTTSSIPTSTSTSSLDALVSSLVPSITSSSFPTITPFTALPTSSQPRKGLNTDGDPDFPPPPTSADTASDTASTKVKTRVTTVTSWTSVAVAAAETTIEAQPSEVPKNHYNNHGPKHEDLSPTAERILIGAGAIGAFIMIIGGLYLLTRMMKIDILAACRGRKFGKGGARGWYGWHKQYGTDYTSDPPPQYDGWISEEKDLPKPETQNAFYSPESVGSTIQTPIAATLSRANHTRRGPQEDDEALIRNPAPIGTSSPQEVSPVSAMESFYGVKAQNTTLTREPSVGFGNTLGTQNTYTTQNTYLTQQTTDVYDPNQREVNHLSYLSSLSSGFGDGLMVPDPIANGQQPPRQSRKFSWMTGASRNALNGPVGDRDTIYTTSSIDTAPRFRTVNSWVAQQTGRVERHLASDKEVPSMPAIPAMHQNTPSHTRMLSSDPAFQVHPGDEIAVSPGQRVPSAILNKKMGIN